MSEQNIPTPTPNSTAPVDIARLRELYHNAVDGPISIRASNAYRSNGEMLASFAFRSEAILYAALRNDAPALLDELRVLRSVTEKQQIILQRNLGNLSQAVAERDKLREEAAFFEKGEADREKLMFEDQLAINRLLSERDSLRQQNEQLLKEIKELKNKG